jgi:hypothetical protein
MDEEAVPVLLDQRNLRQITDHGSQIAVEDCIAEGFKQQITNN